MRVILAYFVIYFIWGANFIAIFFAIQSVPPFLMVGLRFFIAGSIFYLVDYLAHRKPLSFRESLPAIKQGFWLNVCGSGALVWAEQYVPSGLASIVVAAVPVWMILLDTHNWGSNLRNGWIITGLLLGIGGVILLVGANGILPQHSSPQEFYRGIAFLLLGTLGWAYGSIFSKKLKSSISLSSQLAAQMTSAGGLLIVIGMVQGELSHFSVYEISANSLLALGHLIIFGSVIGYLSYIWLLQNRPTAEVGTYTFVNPLTAVVLGALLAGEAVTWESARAMLLIILAILCINYHKPIRRIFLPTPTVIP